MKGVDPLDLNSESVRRRAGRLQRVPAADRRRVEGRGGHPLQRLADAAFVGDRFILASARPLALELRRAGPAMKRRPRGANTHLLVDGKVGLAALTDNREPLIAQNMLEQGHDRAAAEQGNRRVVASTARRSKARRWLIGRRWQSWSFG